MPCLNPILGRNSAEETWKESCDIYKYADMYNDTIFQFVHSEATRHIDPLKGRELIEQSRGKGGITPKGEREFIQMGGGSKHPVRINATGDTAHINILNALIAGFDGTDIGPVIHVHFGGRGIHDFRTKVVNGYKAIQICGENKIFAQLDTHKHINNIGGTDGMAIAMCLLSEGLAVHGGLPWELSGIQMNVGGNMMVGTEADINAGDAGLNVASGMARGYLDAGPGYAARVAAAFEGRVEEGIDYLERQTLAQHAGAQGQHVGVVVAAGHLRAVAVAAQRAAYTVHLVCGQGYTYTGAADRSHSPLATARAVASPYSG